MLQMRAQVNITQWLQAIKIFISPGTEIGAYILLIKMPDLFGEGLLIDAFF